ncbi:LodA/GoxA family CTQ-dependent oxidase [Rhizobium leguminosarum]
MPYKIYPPIGISRLGNDLDRFFVGPEITGHPGWEIDGAGNEAPVVQYKVDEDQIKRQAARFRLFEVPDQGGTPVLAQLPPGCTVEWTVHLVNKKSAVTRPPGPPLQPVRPTPFPGSAPLLIDPGSRTIAGANAGPAKFDTGEFLGRRVPLGELRTDRNQNLIVLGGHGFSSSPTNAALPSFYTNPGWHDDTSDGYVKARVHFPDGMIDNNVMGAWVIVGPPDYAPDIQGVVTLFDILAEVGSQHFGVPSPNQVSFTRDVFPLLLRTRRLQWVNTDPNWQDVNDNWSSLSSTSAGALALRQENADRVRAIENLLQRYRLTSLQNDILSRWESGNFVSDWTGLPGLGNAIDAEGVARAALGGTVGRGFYPGIEGGILLTDPTIYLTPFDFRLDHSQLAPGDLTALMAVPWQADFYDCRGNWWPSQRPDMVRISVDDTAALSWGRGVSSHLQMVHNFPKLGFVTARTDAQGNVVFVETQRADSNLFA